MPHVICEYSANLEPKIRVDALLKVLHEAMMRTGVVELAGLRTRAAPRGHYRIADNDPANGFINIIIRVAKGRTVETRKLILETVFADARRHLEGLFATIPFALSVEVQEIDTDFRLHANNIRDRMKTRESAA